MRFLAFDMDVHCMLFDVFCPKYHVLFVMWSVLCIALFIICTGVFLGSQNQAKTSKPCWDFQPQFRGKSPHRDFLSCPMGGHQGLVPKLSTCRLATPTRVRTHHTMRGHAHKHTQTHRRARAYVHTRHRYGLGYKAFVTAAEFPDYISAHNEARVEVDFPFYNGRKQGFF